MKDFPDTLAYSGLNAPIGEATREPKIMPTAHDRDVIIFDRLVERLTTDERNARAA